jgi:two-component system sensor histidine kinase/response regulator
MPDHPLQAELHRLVQDEPGVFAWIQESCLDGIRLWNLEQQDEEWVSPQFTALLGHQAHEVPDRHDWWQQHIAPEDRSAMQEALRAQLEDDIPCDLVVRFLHRSGGTLWVRCRGLTIRDQHGAPTRLLMVHSDATAMLQSSSAAEEARRLAREKDTVLARTQEQLEYALRGANLGLWDWAITSGGEVLSDTWLDLLGMDRRQATGSVRDWMDRIHPDDRGEVETRLQAHFSGEQERFEAHYRMHHEDGTWHWMESNGQVVERDAEGEPQRMVGIMSDISPRMAIEDALRDAKEKAEQATRAKSEFLATMSHEIRTPLNGVLGMTEVLLKTSLRDEQRDYTETIRTSGQLLLTVINDILDFAKVEAGKLELNHGAFDPRSLLDEVVALFSAEARRKRLELAAMVAPDVAPALLGDETRVRQLLIHLLSKATKFTERGDISIRIDHESRPGGRDGVRLSVKDTGIGMSPTVQRAIFKPFVQAETSTTRRFGGTGLGLSIIERLIVLMGGSIGVESEEGTGTTMTVWLPLEGTALIPTLQRDLSLLQGKRILHADDNPVNRQVLQELAQSWGVEVITCEDAIHALRHLRRPDQRFDCLVTDLHMPDIDGLMLARLMVSDPSIPKTPIVIFTSVTTATVYQQAQSLGICGVITKPIRQGKLLEALLHAFGAPDFPRPDANPQRAAPHVARALLAEDNEINQRLLELQLKELIGELVIVEDGMMAVERARNGDFDLILMDCQMPVMDGYAACLAIRAEEEADGRRPTPIIALTANVMPGDRQRCLDVGMDDYLSKPVRSEELYRVVRKWAPDSEDSGEQASADRPASSAAIEVLQQSVGDRGLRELVSVSIRTFGRLRAAAQTAVESTDLQALARATHSVKGAAAGLGLGDLAAKSHALNLAARESRDEECRRLIEDWDASIENGIDLLTSLQRDPSGMLRDD